MTNNHHIKRAYSDWLSTKDCQLFFTGTYRIGNLSYQAASKTLFRFYKGFHRPDFAFLVIESGERYGRTHVHGLLQYDNMPSVPGLIKAWENRYGFCKFENINDMGGVAGYCSKYINKTLQPDSYFIIQADATIFR